MIENKKNEDSVNLYLRMTEDEIDKFFKDKEDSEKQCIYLEKKAKDYKRKMKKGSLNLVCRWETDINKIDLDQLNTQLIEDIKKNLTKDYVIEILNLDNVVLKVTPTPEINFPKDKLWENRQNYIIARLIEFIEKGGILIPPIISPIVEKNIIAVIDGNNRIALCRFCKLKEIPFIFQKKYIKFTEDLK